MPTIVIPSFPTDNVLMEESTRDSSVRVLLETGDLLENEESRDNVAITNRERVMILLTTKEEVDAQDMLLQFKTVSNVSPSDGEHKGAGNFNVLNVRKFLDSDTQSIISAAGSNIETPVFPTTATFNAVTQKSPRRDGALSVSNVVDKENDYYVPDLGKDFSSSSPQGERDSVEVRPSDSGLVFQLYNPEEEILILEYVNKILNE